MKLLIVAVNQEHSPFPVSPLGALYVTAAAERAGHSVDFIDLMFVRNISGTLGSMIRTGCYGAIGFSIRNLDNCFYTRQKSYFNDVKVIVQGVTALTQVPVILGGSGFSIDPYGWLSRLDAQYGVVGDGEYSFVELIKCIESDLPVRDIRGILSKKNSSRNNKKLPGPSLVSDMDSMYSPAHSKCEYKRYIGKGGFVSVQTKRGCPFKCIYCVYPLLEGCEYRLRSPENIADEIEAVVHEKGAHYFYFTDSVFNFPSEHALTLCLELSRRKLPIKWMAYCNPLGFDIELARVMKEAGCVGVEFGLDVASEKMLAIMGKPFSQSDIQSCLKAASNTNLPFAIHLLFGGPDETPEDIHDSQKFLDSCARPNAVFALLGIRIYANTPIEEIALRQGAISKETDLFDPVYYVSGRLGDNPMQTLDEIAKKRDEWSTPTDWSKLTMRFMQKLINRFGAHPQWRNIRNYGKHMRR